LKKIFIVILLCVWIPCLPAQNNRPRSKNEVIYLMNYIATEACLTGQYKEDSLLLEEIYKRLDSRVDPGLIDNASKNQMINLFNQITDFRIQDIRRQGIRFMRDHAKARAIKSAIPSPVFFLSLTNNIKNPLALAVNIAGMAAQSVTSYLNATERAEMQFYEKNMELNIDQIRALNKLTTTMFDYRQTTATANGLTDNDTVSPESIRKFLAYKKYEPKLRLETLKIKENQHIYEKYYPYWLELANTCHELKQYQECISAIERYEAIRFPLFMAFNDIEYSLSLCKGIDSLAHIYQNNPNVYIPRCLEYLKKIEQNVPVDEWSIRYTAALAYMDLASATSNAGDKATYLNSAYRLFHSNVIGLSARQIAMNEQYMKPVVTPANANQEQKKVYDELRKKREKQLYPVDEAFYMNYHALIGLMEQLKMGQRERDALNATLGESIALLRARDEYCRSTAEGSEFITNFLKREDRRSFTAEDNNFMERYVKREFIYKINYSLFLSRKDYFSIPLVFLSDNAKINIEISNITEAHYKRENRDLYSIFEKNVEWDAYKIDRPTNSNISSWKATCNIKLRDDESKLVGGEYQDFIISDPVGVYRVKYLFYDIGGCFFTVTKEQ